MIHNKKSNQSVESDSELIQTLELAKKDIKTVIITEFLMFMKLSGKQKIKKRLIKFLVVNTISKVKCAPGRINVRLGIAKEKINNLESINSRDYLKQKEKKMKNTEIISDLWNNLSHLTYG